MQGKYAWKTKLQWNTESLYSSSYEREQQGWRLIHEQARLNTGNPGMSRSSTLVQAGCSLMVFQGSTLLQPLFHLPPSHPAFYWRTSLVSPSSFSSSLWWTFDQVVSTEELIKMENYLHACEINREPIFIMKIKHICLTKAQNQGYLKFSIKLYCVNTVWISCTYICLHGK